MQVRVLDAAVPAALAEWLRRWEAWPDREVMAHPEYARLFARRCDRVVCVAGDAPGAEILFPLVLRPLAAEPWASAGERRWDASTPYGYGGPFAWGVGPRDDAAFWRSYERWARAERVVATFARLSVFPLELAALPVDAEERLSTVVVPLGEGQDALWRGYATRVRRWVRRATEANLTVELDRTGARLTEFFAVYTHTMRRHGAAGWYFFERAFFEQLATGLAGHFALFFTRARGEVVSSDLVLCSARRVYYFLGGTYEHAFPLGPNYLLKHRVALWAMAEGKREYVLGGGQAPNDTVFRYKRGFARRGVVPFRVAYLVHDLAACEELVRRRAAAQGAEGRRWEPREGYLPEYRA